MQVPGIRGKGWGMRELQESMEEAFSKAPRILLAQFVTDALAAACLSTTDGLVERLVDHVMSGSTDRFQWDDGDPASGARTLTLDFEDFENKIDRFLSMIPEIIENVSEKISKGLLKTLRKNWSDEYRYQLIDRFGFQQRLEQRWGTGFSLLRMLLTIAREIGEEVAAKNARSRSRKERVLSATLTRIHVRSCQVAAEIVTLIENGYADGAMDRWRTLYEIGVVATILVEGGEEIAIRYIEYDAVEAKSALYEYQRCCEFLGLKPISKRSAQQIERRCAGAVRKFGPDFDSPYDWASPYLKKRRPTFRDLEVAAGRAGMRSYYKFACHNVHAGPRGILFRMGHLNSGDLALPLLAGPSNAGFLEPSQNTALTLTQITILLLRGKADLDTVVRMKILIELSREIATALWRADLRLRADETEFRRVVSNPKPIA